MRAAITNLMMKLVAPPTVVQAAIPGIYRNVPESFYIDTMKFFEENARLCFEGLKDVPGLTPLMPKGAMYIMVSISQRCLYLCSLPNTLAWAWYINSTTLIKWGPLCSTIPFEFFFF